MRSDLDITAFLISACSDASANRTRVGHRRNSSAALNVVHSATISHFPPSSSEMRKWTGKNLLITSALVVV
jgi:hypothetical protein